MGRFISDRGSKALMEVWVRQCVTLMADRLYFGKYSSVSLLRLKMSYLHLYGVALSAAKNVVNCVGLRRDVQRQPLLLVHLSSMCMSFAAVPKA